MANHFQHWYSFKDVELRPDSHCKRHWAKQWLCICHVDAERMPLVKPQYVGWGGTAAKNMTNFFRSTAAMRSLIRNSPRVTKTCDDTPAGFHRENLMLRSFSRQHRPLKSSAPDTLNSVRGVIELKSEGLFILVEIRTTNNF